MTATYPCPACGREANLVSGCPGCGRAPDPEAAELVGLTTYIHELTAAAATARDAYAGAIQELAEARRRRDDLVARVRARTQAPAPSRVPAMPAPAVAASPPAGAARPEASTRTVQNLLFVLGGLLLGAAAIVFTAVAWANVGFTGRAVILGVITLLVLAVSPVARWRRLTGVAETFAAIGLLLMLLDGYAAWYVNLAGVATAASPTGYAALVCAITAAVGLGYGYATGLTGPRLAALLVAQPVLPLLLERS